MLLDDVELHDAVINRIDVDLIGQKLSVEMDFYEHSDSNSRQSLVISFDGVEAISGMVDVLHLKKNSRAGNVNYWIPKEKGVTFIYLVDGCISIKARSIKFAMS